MRGAFRRPRSNAHTCVCGAAHATLRVKILSAKSENLVRISSSAQANARQRGPRPRAAPSRASPKRRHKLPAAGAPLEDIWACWWRALVRDPHEAKERDPITPKGRSPEFSAGCGLAELGSGRDSVPPARSDAMKPNHAVPMRSGQPARGHPAKSHGCHGTIAHI